MAQPNDTTDLTVHLSSVIEAARNLDSAATKWVIDSDRKAAAEAVTWTDLLTKRAHRLREALMAGIQAYDAEHKPYDPRD